MKKIFNVVTLVFIGVTAILDLIALPKFNFGAGFVLFFVYAVAFGFASRKMVGEPK